MKRRSILSLALCLMMVLTLLTPAAQAIQVENAELDSLQVYFDENVSSATLQQAAEGYELLANLRLPVSDLLTSIQIESDGTIAYSLNYDTVVEKIIPIQRVDGVLYLISGGGKYNELFFADNGGIYLNDNLVTIEYDTPAVPVSPNQLISYGDWTEICPYGYPSDYDYLAYSMSDSEIRFGESLIDLSVTAFVSLLWAALPIGGSTLTPVIRTVLIAIMQDLIDIAPYSDAASVHANVYYHNSTNEFWIYNSQTYRIGAEKHVYTAYAMPNYQGESSTQTIFGYVEYR